MGERKAAAAVCSVGAGCRRVIEAVCGWASGWEDETVDVHFIRPLTSA